MSDVPKPVINEARDKVRLGELTLAAQVTEIPVSAFQVLPPPQNVCQVCAADHAPEEPHNPQSLYWQTVANVNGEEAPSWELAMAHCSKKMQDAWIQALAIKGVTVDRDRLAELTKEKGNDE